MTAIAILEPPVLPEGEHSDEALRAYRDSLVGWARMTADVIGREQEKGELERRAHALNAMLASYGVGFQTMNPTIPRSDTDDMLKRARAFHAFLSNAEPSTVIPIAVVSPGE
ncbi:MAG: hypothetical protein AB7J28_15765 [Hyphomonadaceae bacterium]